MNLGEYLSRVRQQAPVIHAISNYVTANDVANVLLACGASPIMADDPEESAYITALSAGLVLNLGTLSRRRVPAMVASGETAARLGRPVLLDPVGAGASPMRTDTARMLLQRLPVTALRCNASELRASCPGPTPTGGWTQTARTGRGRAACPTRSPSSKKPPGSWAVWWPSPGRRTW